MLEIAVICQSAKLVVSIVCVLQITRMGSDCTFCDVYFTWRLGISATSKIMKGITRSFSAQVERIINALSARGQMAGNSRWF